MTRLAWLAPLVVFLGCNGTSTETTPSGDGGRNTSALTCSETAGANWTIEKSKFAFGGTPKQDGPNHWTGPEGAAGGGVDTIAIPNSGAPAQGRPDFSADSEVLKAHVKAYLMGFGIQECQIHDVEVLSSFGGGGPVGGPVTQTSSHNSINLARAIDGIPVAESHASATMNDQDQSTREEIFWPELDADVVAAAKAFRDQLKDPVALAAYKAKLPSGFQDVDGQVLLHHSYGFSTEPLKFHFSYDVSQAKSNGPSGSFDADGKLIQQTF